MILEPPKIKSDTVSPSISHLKFLYIRAYDFSSDACVGVLNCVQLFATPWTIACQASLSTEFSRQEYWSAWPCPPGDLPDPGIELRSLALWADSLSPEPQRKPKSTGVGSLSLLQRIFPTPEPESPALQTDSLRNGLSGKPY